MTPKARASRSDLATSDFSFSISHGLLDRRWPGVALALAAVMLMAGCASRSLTNAPVVDRGTSARVASSASSSNAQSGSSTSAATKVLPGTENAGKPGYYTVKPGDTLIRIGLDTGQNWRDITRWNSIDKPNLIEIGQVLRVAPPVSEPSARPVAASQPPLSTALPPQDSTAARPPANTASNVPVQAPSQPATQAQAQAPSGEDEVAWIWPVPGTPIAGFDEIKNKGIDIAGKAGEPVVASADGRVVYAGAGLRGYGNLIILKHNNTYLTAYAHNQALLVKEDQAVRRGQKIAEMGNSDTDRVKLHFEIRRQGKPVDPLKFLPSR